MDHGVWSITQSNLNNSNLSRLHSTQNYSSVSLSDELAVSAAWGKLTSFPSPVKGAS